MPMSNVATVDELGRERALPADFRESKPVLSASAGSWGAIVAAEVAPVAEAVSCGQAENKVG